MKRTGHQARETRKIEQRYQLTTFLNSKKPSEQRETPIVLEYTLRHEACPTCGGHAMLQELTFQTLDDLKKAHIQLLEEFDELSHYVKVAIQRGADQKLTNDVLDYYIEKIVSRGE